MLFRGVSRASRHVISCSHPRSRPRPRLLCLPALPLVPTCSAIARLGSASCCVLNVFNKSHTRTCTRTFSTSSVTDSYQTWRKYNVSGLAYLAKGDYDHAEKAFRRCSDPSQVNTFMPSLPPAFSAISRANLGSLYRDTGRIHQARECFSHALHHLQNSSDISWHTLASIYREAASTSQALGEVETASRYINEALQLYKDNEIFNRNSSTSTTTSESHTSSKSDPRSITMEYAATLLEWAQILHKQKKLDQAEGVYLRALERLEVIHGKPDFENTKSMSSDKSAVAAPVGPLIDISFAPILTSLATLHYERESWITAQEYYAKASEVYQQHNDPTFLDTLDMVTLCLSRIFPGRLDDVALQHFREGTLGEKAQETTRRVQEIEEYKQALREKSQEQEQTGTGTETETETETAPAQNKS